MFRNTYLCPSWQRDTWSELLALARALQSRSVTATENVFHCVGLNRKEGRSRLQFLDVNGKSGVNQCSGWGFISASIADLNTVQSVRQRLPHLKRLRLYLFRNLNASNRI